MGPDDVHRNEHVAGLDIRPMDDNQQCHIQGYHTQQNYHDSDASVIFTRGTNSVVHKSRVPVSFNVIIRIR